MRLIKSILGGIFIGYALLLFTLTLMLVLIPVWLCTFIKKDYKRTQTLLKLYRGWMAVYMPLIFCPVKVKGREHFKNGQPYIVICNHNSMVDVPVSTTSVPGTHKTLAKREMASIPIFGMIYRSGSILVDRNDPLSRKNSYEKMKKVLLEEHMHLILYPEGTRNKTGEPLKHFYDGAFSLAIETKIPIMPALIFNTRKILPPGKKFYAWPSPVRIDFLEPVLPGAYTKDDVELLKEKTFNLMKEYYVANQ